jgi:hypothetical protein
MFISRDNKVSFGRYGAFEDTIVRFIRKKMKAGAGFL